MAKKILDFTVDTIQSSYSPIGTVKQLDSVLFNIQITENGVAKNISNQTLKLFAKKNDSKIVEQRTDINIINASEGRVSIDLLNSALQCSGFTVFELEISDSTGCISTANFILKVQEKIANDKVIESTTEISALKEIEDYVAQAKIEIQEFKALKDDMVETNNNINVQENLRVQAENLRIEAELNREKSQQKFNQLKTNYFGKEFDTPQERFLNEFEYLNNNGEEKGSFLPFSTNKSHKVQESIEGKTRNMILEGETLQNLLGSSGTNIELVRANNGHHRQILKDLFKQGSYYTFIPMVRLIENVDNSAFIKIVYVDSTIVYKKFKEANSSQINNICLNFEKDIKELKVELHVDNQLDAKLTLDLIALEGDWTNKEVPKYFESIKSIGQEENKISILANGKNLSSIDKVTAVAGNSNIYIINENNFKVGRRYLFTRETTKLKGRITFKDGTFYYLSHASNLSIFFNVIQTIKEFRLYTDTNLSEDFTTTILIEEMPIGTIPTTYEPYKENKKDILIPFEGGLKGINNVKDEINSITNKSIQKIGKYTFTGDENFYNWRKMEGRSFIAYAIQYSNFTGNTPKRNSEVICDRFSEVKLPTDIYDCLMEGIKIIYPNQSTGDIISFGIEKNKAPTVQEFKELLKKWYSENKPLTIYYELAEPVEYDLINQDINLNTYEDLTYITTEATSTFYAPVTISNTIARLNRENKTLEKENIELKKDTKLLASAMLNILEPMLLPGDEINSFNTELLKELNKIVEN